MWDLTRIGAEQRPEEAPDGPPELLVRPLPSPVCCGAEWKREGVRVNPMPPKIIACVVRAQGL